MGGLLLPQLGCGLCLMAAIARVPGASNSPTAPVFGSPGDLGLPQVLHLRESLPFPEATVTTGEGQPCTFQLSLW